MQALIDADLVAYRCAASAENEPSEIAIARCDKLMRDLLLETEADNYQAFLSGERNFRKELSAEYKANRKDVPNPKWLQACREFLVTEWRAQVTDGIEADDALGIAQCTLSDTIIVSLDKDLLQIPGKHYRWKIGTATWTKEAEFLYVSELDGLRSFYSSSLIGDRADNIFGVDGIGPKKAEKALRGAETEQKMFDIVRELYNDDERLFLNLRLLWILREEGKYFNEKERGLINE